MNDKYKPIDPIPDEFDSYEQAAEFWDTHDTTDYLDNWETVFLDGIELKQQHFEVEVETDLMKVLYEQAKQRGVKVSQLVNDMLRETLGDVA
jgi:hypothetical protein